MLFEGSTVFFFWNFSITFATNPFEKTNKKNRLFLADFEANSAASGNSTFWIFAYYYVNSMYIAANDIIQYTYIYFVALSTLELGKCVDGRVWYDVAIFLPIINDMEYRLS